LIVVGTHITELDNIRWVAARSISTIAYTDDRSAKQERNCSAVRYVPLSQVGVEPVFVESAIAWHGAPSSPWPNAKDEERMAIASGYIQIKRIVAPGFRGVEQEEVRCRMSVCGEE
jgi:hypothetical protein